MMLKTILGGVRENIFKGKRQELAPGDSQKSSPPAPAAAVRKALLPDGAPILRLGDELYENNRDDEAEAIYRSAFQSDAPVDLVNRKLQRVVARLAASYEQPGMLLVAPGDGSAVAPTLEDFHATLDAVNRELAKVPEATPSIFWETHAVQHIELLVKHGLPNFKRTVAHNYYNWLTVSISDPQIRSLIELWPTHGSSEALADEMEDFQSAGPQVRLFKDVNARLAYKLGVSLLWDYTLHTDNHGLLRKLAEPVTGNPLKITRRGRLLSQDLAHSVRERNLILDATGLRADSAEPIVIGELGAGHGRLAHVFAMSTNCRYMIFDIAPALLVSQWYIQSLFPGEKIFVFRPFDNFEDIAEELSQCRFAFFASSQLETFPENYFNLFINVCSLMEMRLDSINYFFREIERVTRGHFYTKQWLVQNNRKDNISVKKEDYPVPAHWKNLHDSIDPINRRLFQQVWQIP
jgi:putative sugar O-methyltransferase